VSRDRGSERVRPAGTLDSGAFATSARPPMALECLEAATDPAGAETNAVDYPRRAIVGGAALVLRQGLVKGLSIVGGVILARILTPEAFGTYAIVAFVVAAFSLVGDLGLGAALIQQEAEPTDHDYRVIFTIQLVVFGSGSAAVIVFAPWIAAGFGLSSDGVWLMRILALGLLVSALRTLPAVRLERHLEFGRLVLAEAAQAIVFQVVAVAAAVSGLGVVSFGVAALAGTVTATVIINVIAPWRPGLAGDWTDVRRFLRFGLPYQGIGVLSFIQGAVNPLFIGIIAGVAAVGLVNWAAVVMGYPLLISAILSRLYFPAFSRLRSRPEVRLHRNGADRAIRSRCGLLDQRGVRKPMASGGAPPLSAGHRHPVRGGGGCLHGDPERYRPKWDRARVRGRLDWGNVAPHRSSGPDGRVGGVRRRERDRHSDHGAPVLPSSRARLAHPNRRRAPARGCGRRLDHRLRLLSCEPASFGYRARRPDRPCLSCHLHRRMALALSPFGPARPFASAVTGRSPSLGRMTMSSRSGFRPGVSSSESEQLTKGGLVHAALVPRDRHLGGHR
jgi:hypothetical protein